jgi:hypothetical protein
MNNRLFVSIFKNPVLAMWKDVGEIENIVHMQKTPTPRSAQLRLPPLSSFHLPLALPVNFTSEINTLSVKE